MKYLITHVGDIMLIVLMGYVIVDVITNKKSTPAQLVGKLLMLGLLFILKLR